MIFGAVIDESLGDEVRVTVIATGFGGTPGAAGRSRVPRRRAARGRPRRASDDRRRPTPSSTSRRFLRED